MCKNIKIEKMANFGIGCQIFHNHHGVNLYVQSGNKITEHAYNKRSARLF